MINDPVGDLFTRIKNAALAKKREVVMPYSKLKLAVLETLQKEGYIQGVKRVENKLVLELVFYGRESVINGIRGVSSPGLRIYRGVKKLPRPLGGAGVSIVSTPKGVMSDREARKKKLGGEVLGEVW